MPDVAPPARPAGVVDPARIAIADWIGRAPVLIEQLQRLGIGRVGDLWLHLPLRYEDKTRITPIRQLIAGDKALVEGVVDTVDRRLRGRPQLLVALDDGSGATLVLRFFHFRSSQAEQLRAGTRLRVFGEVRHGLQGPEIVHPRYERIAPGTPLAAKLSPVYPTVDGLSQPRLQRLIAKALALLPPGRPVELLPAALLPPEQRMPLRDALFALHQPPPDADLAQLNAGAHPALLRVVLEELVAHNLSLQQLRQRIRGGRAPRLKSAGRQRSRLLRQLPFRLTTAQQRVLEQIDGDLRAGVPMLRLLQGDVGSGKTVVAALAALSLVDAGYQAAVMAPTEVLSEQHLRNFAQWLEPLGVRVVRLTGAVKGKARQLALAAVAGDADVIVGTHALMQDAVQFRNLGLAIIDEQHRFGVHQRLALRDKGARSDESPHQLVMTATPIPRTLAMTAYADLDCSVIDELPPGRTPIKTVVLGAARRDDVVERIRAACAEGRQAYWVCTLIDESDELEAQAAEATFAALGEALPEIRVGLVHGRMKTRDKQEAMAAFAANQTRLLVATTVIEVGVDVPNASLMVIDNAERLGLSQLHQLRGRVGRGAAQSTCVLLFQGPLSETAKQRLALMRETNDGFRIAEQDLQMRGPGELLGTRQTGEAAFRVAQLARDASWLPQVALLAERILAEHPDRVEPLIARWIGVQARYAQA